MIIPRGIKADSSHLEQLQHLDYNKPSQVYSWLGLYTEEKTHHIEAVDCNPDWAAHLFCTRDTLGLKLKAILIRYHYLLYTPDVLAYRLHCGIWIVNQSILNMTPNTLTYIIPT